MRGVCLDGPAEGASCEGLPKPPPKTLDAPHDIKEYVVDTVPQSTEPGTEYPVIGCYGYRFDRSELQPGAHPTVPGAPELVAYYRYDRSLGETDGGYVPSSEDWSYSEQPVGLRS